MKEKHKTKVLVLYYSAWGHMEQMAYAAAEGADRQAGRTRQLRCHHSGVRHALWHDDGAAQEFPRPDRRLVDEGCLGRQGGFGHDILGDGSRQPASHELDGARFQGKHVATIAAKLAAK